MGRNFLFEWEVEKNLKPYMRTILEETEQKLRVIEQSRCKGIEIEPGHWSGCNAAETGAKDCPTCQSTPFVRLDPSKLLGMIASGELRPGVLTWAAEVAGKIPDSGSVIPVLLKLLDHASPMVREGAIYGLASHMSEEVIARIIAISQTDPVPEVMEVAKGALEAHRINGFGG